MGHPRMRLTNGLILTSKSLTLIAIYFLIVEPWMIFQISIIQNRREIMVMVKGKILRMLSKGISTNNLKRFKVK